LKFWLSNALASLVELEYCLIAGKNGKIRSYASSRLMAITRLRVVIGKRDARRAFKGIPITASRLLRIDSALDMVFLSFVCVFVGLSGFEDAAKAILVMKLRINVFMA